MTPNGAPGRVLLAIDLTAASSRAIEQAISMAAADHAGLGGFSVVEPSSLPLPGGRPRRVDQERDRLESGVRTVVGRAKASGVAATYLVWEGAPAESILEASASEGADVIVLGSRRRTDLRRLLLGSGPSEGSGRAGCRGVVGPA